MQFSIAKPEEVGVSSAALSQTLDYLAQRRVALHSLLVMRHDALICEGYAAPFTKDTLHRMYSETKSLVSLAVGVMCAKGYLDLDDHIVDHFAEKLPLGGPSPELARLARADLKLLKPQPTWLIHICAKRFWGRLANFSSPFLRILSSA